jgi:hypothetical protein
MHAIDTLYKGSDTDKLQAIVLKLGYIGQDGKLPSDTDIRFLMEHMGGATQGAAPVGVITPPHTEIPVSPVTLHPIRIFTDGVPAESGKIIAEKTLNIPYFTATEMQEIAKKVADDAIRSPDDLATRHVGETLLASTTNIGNEIPLIPYFLPFRRGLESAYMEPIVLTPEAPNRLGSTMLAPFGIETALLTHEQLAQRTSPRLTEKPDSILNQQEEVSWYVSNLSEEEKARTAELLTQVATPMTAETKAAVIIPVYNNSSSLAQSVQNYLGQVDTEGKSIDPKSFEMVFYNAIQGETPDQVKATIDQLKMDHPEAQITYLSHTYPEQPTNGMLKRDVTNAVLTRIANRVPVEGSESPLPDVVIVNDAGANIETPPTYLSSMIEGLSDQTVDMIHGQFKYPNEVYEQLPMVFAQYRAYELMDALTRHTHGENIPNVVSGNTAVRASTLAAVGGYNAGAVASEDRELAWMITSARAKPESVQTSSEVVSFDPKPALYQMLQRENIADPSIPLENNETFKSMSWQEMGEKIRVDNDKLRKQIALDMTTLYNGMYPQLRATDPEGFDRNFNFTLDSLGLAHEITDGNVTILDESKLASAITGIPDIESFANITAQTFAEQDRSAREILSNMAGAPAESQVAESLVSPETPEVNQTTEAPAAPENTVTEVPKAHVNPEQPLTETLNTNISSPDVINIGQLEQPISTPDVSPEALAKEEPLPVGINDRIDYVLGKHQTEQSAIVPVSPAELMDYLKTSIDIAGTRITDGNLAYADGKLHLQGLKAKSFGGEYQFDADLMSDPNKGLIVDPSTLKMKIPFMGRLFSGTIKNFALNLSDNMLAHIDERTNPMWKASRIDLVGQNIEIHFDKKV